MESLSFDDQMKIFMSIHYAHLRLRSTGKQCLRCLSRAQFCGGAETACCIVPLNYGYCSINIGDGPLMRW
ncbi:glucose-6-phosphate isomerase family protein [Enterobacter pseudoroggenkampii]|uniref:glucose-6-phosphate isomerase family protein n=1 Tax=Enterobacter pseudoroggenkampii TaxID=2996112 RepID=UPI003CC910FD